MSRVRQKCRHCGRGYLCKPYDKNGVGFTCRKMRCEKKSGIYVRPVKKENEIEKDFDALRKDEKYI